MDPYSPTQNLSELLARQRAAHAAQAPSYAQRDDDLARLRAAFKRRLPDLLGAMAADFDRRSRHESASSDGLTVLTEIDHARAHLRAWMKPRRVHTNWLFWPARAEIRRQPLGVVGVISPWNYPVNLALGPLISALAAGNHAMIKPSEHTPQTSLALAALLAEVFPIERVATVLGGADVAAKFAALPFDHLLFTGSTAVGRKVMAAAAPNLTPLTLELGGKSPAIVAPGYSLSDAAARIATGKFFNAGQTCIAPDYVLLPRNAVDAFAVAMQARIKLAYGDWRISPDYTAIINERQFARLQHLVEDARQLGARVLQVESASIDGPKNIFPPTLILDAPPNALVMQEEIFGPILPILGYDTLDAAIEYVNGQPRPLALYHFDHDAKRTEALLERTIAGGVMVNDTLLHFAHIELPFGGVGPSGMGQHHGYAGFLALSKMTSVFYQARFPGYALLRPPYRGLADRLMRFLTR